MSVSTLALRRARKQLDDFCAQRSTPDNVLTCQSDDDSLLLQHEGQVLVRLQLEGAQWRVFWRRDDGHWIPWPHLPVCNDFKQVIEELEQAPLHVHWSNE